MTWQQRIARYAVAIGAVTSAGVVTGFLGELWWIFDLTSHFRVQYVASLLVAVIPLFLLRRSRVALLFCGFLLLDLLPIVPLYLPDTRATAESPVIKILSVNVHSRNTASDDLLNLIASENPDVILLMEVTKRWMERLRDLRSRYPHVVEASREDNFGIALFSRIPFADGKILDLGETPSVTARIPWGNGSLTIVGVHPLPPVGGQRSADRNEQLALVAAQCADEQRPLVLVGDLNVSPWSSAFTSFTDRSGLADSMRGYGFQPSWPTHFFPLSIPIDHCLISPDLKAVDRRIGPHIGSDHYPVIVTIAPVKS